VENLLSGLLAGTQNVALKVRLTEIGDLPASCRPLLRVAQSSGGVDRVGGGVRAHGKPAASTIPNRPTLRAFCIGRRGATLRLAIMNMLYDERLDGPLPIIDQELLLADFASDPTRRSDLAYGRTNGALRMRWHEQLPERALGRAAARGVAQVQTLMRHCHQHGVPACHGRPVPDFRASNACATGHRVIAGAFQPDFGCGSRTCTARVQPGVRNLAVSEAAAPYGLYYAPDPSSQTHVPSAGNVAENAVACIVSSTG